MPQILETDHFYIIGHDQPHHCRSNGGYAKLSPKEKYGDRAKMPMELYLAMMHLNVTNLF